MIQVVGGSGDVACADVSCDGVTAGGVAADGVAGKGVTFAGVVVDGDKRGRLLGFPTANIAVAEGGDVSVPADGVYACWVSFPPEATRYGATVSIGDNPTFDDVTDRRVEAFVHDLTADLYGRSIVVSIAGRLRSMVRCASLDELILRTAEDVERSRVLLAGG
jgi:riboflavin kinase